MILDRCEAFDDTVYTADSIPDTAIEKRAIC